MAKVKYASLFSSPFPDTPEIVHTATKAGMHAFTQRPSPLQNFTTETLKCPWGEKLDASSQHTIFRPVDPKSVFGLWENRVSRLSLHFCEMKLSAFRKLTWRHIEGDLNQYNIKIAL